MSRAYPGSFGKWGAVFGIRWQRGRLRARLARWTTTAASNANPPSAPIQPLPSAPLGRLTAGVAHDFNNLLTIVLGNATALRIRAEAQGDAQAARRATQIEQAAERGGRLAAQLLAYARQQYLQAEDTRLGPLLGELQTLLARAAGEQVRLRVSCAPLLWLCRVDPTQLESALLNLVINARDAMPDGGTISIRAANMSVGPVHAQAMGGRPGDYLRIDVSDTGCGIPAELQAKVFEPFFTTKPVGKGSGLGLAQVHGFVGQSGGWVELHSAPGNGTTVSLVLPRARPGRRPIAGAPDSRRLGRRILLVAIGEAVQQPLLNAGYEVVRVNDPAAAQGALQAAPPPDVLLVDRVLPDGSSGLALAAAAHALLPGLHVVLTAASARDLASADRTQRPAASAVAAAEDQPADGAAPGEQAPQEPTMGEIALAFTLLPKPYRPDELLRVLDALFCEETEPSDTAAVLSALNQRPQFSQPAYDGSTAAAGPAVRGNAIRLGVMPIRALRDTSEAELAVGLAEEISDAMSRFRGVICLTPASVAAAAAESLGQSARWRQLDLDFVLEGTLQRDAERLRLTVRLIDMRNNNAVIWGRRFDGLLSGLAGLKPRIAAETVAQVAPELMLWAGDNLAARPDADPTAYQLMLRAIPAIYRVDQSGFDAAGGLLEDSLCRDPDNAAAHAWLAHWHMLRVGQGWAEDGIATARQAEDHAARALALDPEDARGLTIAGHVRAFLSRAPVSALELHARALAINPNLAIAWCYRGLACSYVGQHDEAVKAIEQAQALSPFDPYGFFFDMALIMPYLLTGQYEKAARHGRRALARHPGLSSTHKGLLSALGHLGADAEAATIRHRLLELEPGFTVREAIARSPLQRAEDLECYAAGLRRAGLPEGDPPALGSLPSGVVPAASGS